MDTTTINNHDPLFLCGAKDAHHLMEIWTAFVRIKMGRDFIEDAGAAIRHGPHDIEQDATGDATPAVILLSGLAFETLLGMDLALAQRAGGQEVCTPLSL